MHCMQLTSTSLSETTISCLPLFATWFLYTTKNSLSIPGVTTLFICSTHTGCCCKDNGAHIKCWCTFFDSWLAFSTLKLVASVAGSQAGDLAPTST